MKRLVTLLFLTLVTSSFAGTEGVVLDDVTKQVKNPMVIFGADTTIDVTDATKIGFPSGGGGGAVASIFGRTGIVTAQSGDYSFPLISGLLSFGQLDRTSTVVSEAATVTIAANTRIKTTATGTLTTFAFSGGNNVAQARRVDVDVSGGPFTITIPTTRRIGETGSVSSLTIGNGYHEISWEYIAGEYVMADSIVAPLPFTNLVDVPSSYVGQSNKIVRVNTGETGLEFVNAASGGGTGDVIGPSSATDNAIARFDGTTGKLIQNSGATINDSGNLTATNFSGSSSGTNTGDQDLSGLVTNTRTVNGHALSSNVTVMPGDLSLVIGTNVEAWDADLDTWATKTPYAGSLTITTGKTFNVTNTLTLSGTDASTLNIGGGGTLGTAAFTASSAYQPIDSDLTAIAALVTDPFGRDLLIKTSAANVRSYIGAGTSSFDGAFSSLSGTPTTLSGYGITDAQPLDADLTTIAGLTATTDNFMVSVASAWASRTPSQVRTTLGLVIGTNVEAWDADLDTWATLAPSANFQTMVPHTFSQIRTDLGLVIGTNVQAWDADLDTWATLTPSANFQTMIPHTFAQMRTDLGLVIGTNVEAWDTQLDSLAGLSYTGNSLKVVRVNSGETGFELVAASGGGDFSSNTSTSVDGEIVLFSGTGGKTGKRATGTGIAKTTNGVLGTATAGTDYDPAPTIAFNANAQSITAATDTYITSSGLSVPASIHVGTKFKWTIRITKTAAGTAAATWNIRFGTAGTTSDTARVTATSAVQTATAEVGLFRISAIVTATGASGTILGTIEKSPGVSASGLGSIANQLQSSAFDTTVGSSIIGVSVNSGAAAVWTVDNIETEIVN